MVTAFLSQLHGSRQNAAGGWGGIFNNNIIMKIKSVRIENFRGFKNEATIDFCDLTAIVGRNDAGKSTVLEALDIFFNEGKGVVSKIEKDDINKSALEDGNKNIVISVVFSDLPNQIEIDDTYSTTLRNEFLLNSEGYFEVRKVYENASQTPKVYIRCRVPADHEQYAFSKLILTKQKDLQNIAKSLNVEVGDNRINSLLRAAIWGTLNFETCDFVEEYIDVSAKEGDVKDLWSKICKLLPIYCLFQSDRPNKDKDKEIQDPLKVAVQQILTEESIQIALDDIASKVKEKLESVTSATLSKIREMNSEVANSLHPVIPETQSLKWSSVFGTVSIAGDEDIPINKRGSGIRRLILLNFFRAQAEQKAVDGHHVIYAIEEPETSQHLSLQKQLIESLKELPNNNNAQVIITTHSSNIVKMLSYEQIKMIIGSPDGNVIRNITERTLPYPSLNEVNYLVFGEVNEEYHDELYGSLQSIAVSENSANVNEDRFDKWLKDKCHEIEERNWHNDKSNKNIQHTLQTFIRNYVHHPENHTNTKFGEEDIKKSIDQMRYIYNLITNRTE